MQTVPRMMKLARLRLKNKTLATVMNHVFLLLDTNEYRQKQLIEDEAYEILKDWQAEVEEAVKQGMTLQQFAAYLIYDALKIEILSGNHHKSKGQLSDFGIMLFKDALVTIRLLLHMDLVHETKVKLLILEIKKLADEAGGRA